MRYIKQINNLKIYYSNYFNHCIVTPNKIIIEDRLTLKKAENFCRHTLDYTKRKEVR